MPMYVQLHTVFLTSLTCISTQHVEWWRELQGSFANQSNLTTSGKSFEGRDIFGLHLWGASGPGKPAVLYHGTVHAREWIAAPYVPLYLTLTEIRLTRPSTIEYIAQQLVHGYKSGDNITQSFLNNYDFYIFPFVNPDG
jgi:murein tripeptide amidase MpaA